MAISIRVEETMHHVVCKSASRVRLARVGVAVIGALALLVGCGDEDSDSETAGLSAEVGECVYVSGTDAQAGVVKATCGIAPANFKVVSKAPAAANCPSDSDQTVAAAGGALCLDLDWVVDQCMSVPSAPDANPSHSPCNPGQPDTYRLLGIINTTDTSQCPPATTKDFPYKERNMTACVNMP